MSTCSAAPRKPGAAALHQHKRLATAVGLFAVALGAAISLAVPATGDDGDHIATITVPESVSITAGSDARDRYDAPLEVRGGAIEIAGPGDAISVPVVVPGGWVLESLTDTTTGITIVRNANGALLRIPIRDADGNDTIRVLVNTTDYIGDGWQATATILSMSIDLPTRSRDFTEVDSEVGVASVKILGEITGFPGNSVMEMSIAKSAQAADLATVEGLANATGLEVADVAYVVGLDKTNLDRVLGEMTLRLTVGKTWIDRFGLENIRVVRLADDGSTQVFEWLPVDPEADPAQFNLVSPDGLSKFVIEALRKIQATPTPTPSPTPTVTPTFTPSPTPTSTPTPAPTATPEPTAMPAPTAAIEPMATPRPTLTAVATPASSATGASAASATPTATVPPPPPPTPAPTPTRVPSNTPVSTNTPVPPTPTDVTGANAESAEEVVNGSSCNATAPTGNIGLGQLAFLLFPVGLIVYSRAIKH